MKQETIKISKTGADEKTMLHPQIRTGNNISNTVVEDYLKTCKDDITR